MSISNSAKDLNIISLIKSEDESGFAQLIKTYASSVYGMIFRMVNDQRIADELLQLTVKSICVDIKNDCLKNSSLFTCMMQTARRLVQKNMQSAVSSLKPMHFNSILDLVFNKGKGLAETAQLMNISTAEAAVLLRTELKQQQN